MLPPAGQIFEKGHPLENVEQFSKVVGDFQAGCWQGCCLRRVSLWKNDVPLKMLNGFPNFVAIFKQGASRGAASGGSDF